ncbi:hypothetical protein [Streptomyces avermitilis]|uniref:hypothetical protein n=1 Tax=Streptomyces avermitilis TaxID=33903 RepID=UPI00381B0451
MTRLNTEPAQPSEVHAVLTDPDISYSAKVCWAYLTAVADPQQMKPMAEALSMAEYTVSRSLKALEAKSLARRTNGVWLPEVPQ